ncbi:hypothetical protein INR49_019073 [Caranx melampygus]|nr:hypothetical protein INR49_019073 [Caranx melampygus]
MTRARKCERMQQKRQRQLQPKPPDPRPQRKRFSHPTTTTMRPCDCVPAAIHFETSSSTDQIHKMSLLTRAVMHRSPSAGRDKRIREGRVDSSVSTVGRERESMTAGQHGARSFFRGLHKSGVQKIRAAVLLILAGKPIAGSKPKGAVHLILPSHHIPCDPLIPVGGSTLLLPQRVCVISQVYGGRCSSHFAPSWTGTWTRTWPWPWTWAANHNPTSGSAVARVDLHGARDGLEGAVPEVVESLLVQVVLLLT